MERFVTGGPPTARSERARVVASVLTLGGFEVVRDGVAVPV